MPAPFEIADFSEIVGVPCPCGTARRAFAGVRDFPGTVHVTEIAADAKVHYHKRLTETYFFLECGPDARMQLNDEEVPVRPGMCIMIRPGTRHRAIGRMKVLILVLPKFDPADEWFDDPQQAAQHSAVLAAQRLSNSSIVRPKPMRPNEEEPAEDEVPAPAGVFAAIRFVTTKAFLVAGLMLAAVLLLLALWMPQIPRQRAISLVEAKGGSVYYDTNLPEWMYNVFGDRVERFQHIYEINLDGTGIDDSVVPHLVYLREAHVVWLNSADVTDAGVRHLLAFPRITSLDLGATRVTEESLLPLLRKNRELDTIWLQDTAITDATLEVLAATPTVGSLTISHTRISDDGLKHLAALPALTSLVLDGNPLSGAGLDNLSSSTSLVDVSLMDTPIDDTGMAALARMPALTTLNLSNTKVTDEGMRALAASTSLVSLTLDGTQISDGGLVHLAAMPSLTTLSLDGTQVTDAGLDILATAKHLSDVYVNNTGVTVDGIVTFQKAHPDCSISYEDQEVMYPM